MTERENTAFSNTVQDQWLADLMDEYGDRLTKLAYSYLRDWGKAQEIVQDVFLTCYEKYDTYEEILSYKAWVYRITINRCKDALRSAWARRVVVNSGLFQFFRSTEPSPETFSLQKDADIQLAEKVMELPVKYREIIHLHYYEELSVQEIAQLLNMNRNTVKTRLKRGRSLMEGSMERGEWNEG
ncbi:sigma-70 family RNA polymerase sigma factor [Sporosarcina trichiuri]|uniref:sigma-70 family RNA polymerase sigma factor n=1 Tax=Sporosarcina trichiuri TaxID=3056445 RepID=UPI0025B60F38|nr:sigma-70 family RNA polymerase sigma factor [Sporosarcina sp. 0.2-SM1T-5]WJY27543.1 sigma-70 family RNA polymerase sigma factor [Sporosarcina sp. 0.2-SM1T-5]